MVVDLVSEQWGGMPVVLKRPSELWVLEGGLEVKLGKLVTVESHAGPSG